MQCVECSAQCEASLPFAVFCVLCVVHSAQCLVCHVPCDVCCVEGGAYNMQCAVLSVLFSVQCAVCHVMYMNNEQFVVCSDSILASVGGQRGLLYTLLSWGHSWSPYDDQVIWMCSYMKN